MSGSVQDVEAIDDSGGEKSGDAITQVDPTNVPPNPLFKLVIVASAAFLITILLMVATTLSSARSPVRQFIDQYGLRLIGIELTVMFVSGFLAMLVDRRQTLSRQAEIRMESEKTSDSIKS